MLEPVHFENETLIIRSFNAQDLESWSGLVDEIFELLSDQQALKYLPYKRLYSQADADALLKNALINLYCGRNYLHFIRKKSDGGIIGLIDVISPDMARDFYQLNQYPYFIEFCIKTEFSKKRLMSTLLPNFLKLLGIQRIGEIAAVINRHNIAAQKVLHRSGFSYQKNFDVFQDLYRFRPATTIAI